MDAKELELEILTRLREVAEAEDPLALVEEWPTAGAPAAQEWSDEPFVLAQAGHGLASWRFVICVHLPQLTFEMIRPMASAFASEEAKERDAEKVRMLCRLVYAAVTGVALPENATRAVVRFLETDDRPAWRVESADGTVLQEGDGWLKLLDLFAEIPDPALLNFLCV